MNGMGYRHDKYLKMCVNEPTTAAYNIKIIFYMQQVWNAKNLMGVATTTLVAWGLIIEIAGFRSIKAATACINVVFITVLHHNVFKV